MTTLAEQMNAARRSRASLKDWLKSVLSALSQGGEFAAVNLWGIRGSGKTRFLYELRELFLPLSDAFVCGPFDAAQIPYEELVKNIAGQIDGAPPTSNKVLLLDNVEAVSIEDGTDRADFSILETDLLLQLVQRSDILVVITSLHELRQWHYMEIKMRQISLLLPPVDRSELVEIAKGATPITSDLFKQTFGYPPLITWVTEHPGTDLESMISYAENALLTGLPSKVQASALLTSLLLDFDVAILQKVAKIAGVNLGETYHDFSTTIQKLGIMGFVLFDIHNGGFRFTSQDLRRLLARIYCWRQPEKFVTIHMEMAAFYQQEVRRASFVPQNLINIIFHLAWANSSSGKESIDQACQEWIQSTISLWIGVDWPEVLLVWKTGGENPEVIEEIGGLMGQEAYQRIQHQIEQRINQNTEPAGRIA